MFLVACKTINHKQSQRYRFVYAAYQSQSFAGLLNQFSATGGSTTASSQSELHPIGTSFGADAPAAAQVNSIW